MIIVAAAFLLVTDRLLALLVVLQHHTGGSAAMLNIIRGVTRNSTTSSVMLLLHNSSANFTGAELTVKTKKRLQYVCLFNHSSASSEPTVKSSVVVEKNIISQLILPPLFCSFRDISSKSRPA